MVSALVRGVSGWINAHPLVSFVVFFSVFPLWLPSTALATQILIFGLFALGFNLLYGYTGILSFGHAAYYGLGAYGTGIALAKLGLGSIWLGLACGLAAALVGGVIIGFFCLRRRGIYFAMLTLAFAQLLYFIGFHLADLTGGDDGLRGIPQLRVGLPGFSVSIESSLAFYYFSFVLVALAVAGLTRILDSPFGAVLRAIRENSERAAACGYDISKAKLLSFVFSAMFTGLAGSLDALRLTVVASLLVAVINVVFGTLIAWVLVRDDFPGKRVVDGLIDLPFALPTIVAGLVLLALYGPQTPIGIDLAYTRTAVLVALLFVTLPFVVRTVQPVLMELDRDMEEAAASLGAGNVTIFRRVVLPNLVPAILAGTALSFARAIAEFGSTVLISGNIPFKTQVSAVQIFGQIESDNRTGAAAVATVLLIVALAVIVALDLIKRWSARRG